MLKTYTTVQGDYWDTIALDQLGSEYYLSELMEANRKYIGIVVFPAGIVLQIPDISPKTSLTLPPWKR